jgi:hypothetical protein
MIRQPPLLPVAERLKPKTLIFVPQTNLTSLDPVWTTATATRNFGLMVYEGCTAATSNSCRGR